MPFYGSVDHEAVYFLTKGGAMRIPTPPTMRNHGNYVASALPARPLARRAGRGRRRDDPARRPPPSGSSCSTAASRGVRTGDKGRGRNGEPLPNFEPGSDITGRVTVLAEGTQGHLTGVAIDRFGLAGARARRCGRSASRRSGRSRSRSTASSTRWAGRSAAAAQYREFGGSFIYPMGDDMVTLGMVVGLDYRDAELSVHDCSRS